MGFEPVSSPIGLWSQNALDSATRWARGLLNKSNFTPNETLAEAKNIDPRLVPKVPMQSADIDVGLLSELSKLGMKHGKLVTEQSHPELMQAWKTMAQRAGFKKAPQLIIVDSKIVNALTVSPEEVVLTTGLLKKLDLREVSAVGGHELGHATSDHRTPRIIATILFGGAGIWLANRLAHNGGIGSLLDHSKPNPNMFERALVKLFGKGEQPASLLANALYMSAGFSAGSIVANQIAVRPTELQADIKGAQISGDPQGLVSALQKLEDDRASKGIINVWNHLRSGYPSTKTRIRNLEHIAAQLPPPVLPPAVAAAPAIVAAAAQQPSLQISSIAQDQRVEVSNLPHYALN